MKSDSTSGETKRGDEVVLVPGEDDRPGGSRWGLVFT